MAAAGRVGGALTVSFYNPLQAIGARASEILSELRQDVVLVAGTQRKASPSLPIRASSFGASRFVEAGWRSVRDANKSCGVGVFLGPRLAKAAIVGTYTPPASLQGRAIAVRLKGPSVDLMPVAMYFPPRPATSKAMAGYTRTVRGLVRWMTMICAQAGCRTLPLIGMDLNDVVLSDGASLAVGPLAGAGAMRDAAMEVVQAADAVGLAFANTFFSGEHTF